MDIGSAEYEMVDDRLELMKGEDKIDEIDLQQEKTDLFDSKSIDAHEPLMEPIKRGRGRPRGKGSKNKVDNDMNIIANKLRFIEGEELLVGRNEYENEPANQMNQMRTRVNVMKRGRGRPRKHFPDDLTIVNKIIKKQAKELLTCPACGKTFVYQSLLSNHFISHSNQTKFTCIHCSKSFKQKSILTKHLINSCERESHVQRPTHGINGSTNQYNCLTCNLS